MNKIIIEANDSWQESLDIVRIGEVNKGGAYTKYVIQNTQAEEEYAAITFQDGNPHEQINGASNEALLTIVLDRMRSWNQGEFKCRENALAITKLEEVLHWLDHRTNRIQRIGEGTH